MDRKIRELELGDINSVIGYFIDADDDFLKEMGVDREKLPTKGEWRKIFLEEFDRSISSKKSFYLIWLQDGKAVGHSNINKIDYGNEAYMHLHLWDQEKAQSGNGAYFAKRCVELYFKLFKLEKIFCEPNALNPGVNKTLEKIGFELLKEYDTVPGEINFHQTVNRWVLPKGKVVAPGKG